MVRLLLQDSRVDPSGRKNNCLYRACAKLNIDMVRLLLSHFRVSSSCSRMTAIKYILMFNRPTITSLEKRKVFLEIVKLLPDEQPNYFGRNRVIKRLLRGGYDEISELL